MSDTTQKVNLKNDFSIYSRLFIYVRPYLLAIIISFIANAIYSAIDAGLVYSIKPILNKGFDSHNTFYVKYLPPLVIVVFLARGLANVTGNCTMTYAARSVIMRIRQTVFAHLLKLPASFYDKNTSGKILSVILFNVEQISNATANALIVITQSGFLVIGLLYVMLSISWKLTLFFIIAAPIILTLIRYSTKRARRIGYRLQDVMGNVTATAEEVTKGYRLVRTFGNEDYEFKKFKALTKLHRRREVQNAIIKYTSVSSVQVVIGVVIAIIIYLTLSHHVNMDAGSFISLIAAAIAILKPFKNITRLNNTLQQALAGAQSVFSLLDKETEKDTGNRQIENVQGKITYQNVSFAYPEADKTVLHHIDLTIEPGQMIAFVGHSGGGKSTLMSLLLRFYDDYTGNILIDDTDIREFTLASLRHQFSFVSQNVQLFNDTIAHNIAYGDALDTNKEKIIHAAKMAYIWDFINALPQGLETAVGENGLKLSGGQRQRIAIARAIFKDAPILIFDEATASLDTESERYIQNALQEIAKNRTTLVIAHRLSTIQQADKIIVIDHGNIVETGSHEALLARDGYYTKLHKLQFESQPSQ
ncbi:MAG: lipid A export permease/ATP-binding protein MsbA [Pseudomonadota bacterium]